MARSYFQGGRAKFSFFKAGQGAFYGGQIKLSDIDKSVTIVYDCGTSGWIKGNAQSLSEEIEYFRRENSKIDLLFISHLDYDHVSGLKQLLDKFTIKKVILPYIEKENRILFLCSFSYYEEVNNDLMTIGEYSSFLDNPAHFISENSDADIYFIKSDNEDEVVYRQDNDNNPDDIYPIGTESSDAIEEFKGFSKVSVYKNNLQFFIHKKWEFTTFVKDVGEEVVERLYKSLKKLLEKNKITSKDLLNGIKDKRKEINKCYTNIDNINAHGLILLHGPVNFYCIKENIFVQSDLDCFYGRHYYSFPHDFICKDVPMLGTLLLGDTSLNPQNNLIEFREDFKNKLKNVHIFQVPHHGSSKNWDWKEFKKLNIGRNCLRQYFPIAVCNFGYGNAYGHPSHQVLSDLKPFVFLNTQFLRFNVEYTITWNIVKK